MSVTEKVLNHFKAMHQRAYSEGILSEMEFAGQGVDDKPRDYRYVVARPNAPKGCFTDPTGITRMSVREHSRLCQAMVPLGLPNWEDILIHLYTLIRDKPFYPHVAEVDEKLPHCGVFMWGNDEINVTMTARLKPNE